MSEDINLDQVRVASPCSANWEAMSGDDRARFCNQCEKHVYNLSGMSRSAAAALIRENEGDLCVRFYQRADGTVLTSDCPVGLRAVRRRLAAMMGRVAAVFVVLLGGSALLARTAQFRHRLRDAEPFSRIYNYFAPPSVPLMGAVCVPIPAPNNNVTPTVKAPLPDGTE